LLSATLLVFLFGVVLRSVCTWYRWDVAGTLALFHEVVHDVSRAGVQIVQCEENNRLLALTARKASAGTSGGQSANGQLSIGKDILQVFSKQCLEIK
jgi:hypothetical protein